MLEAFGFRVVDLGTDVAAARFVEAVRQTGAGLVGLSALLTSTMPAMKTVCDALVEAGLRPRVRVAVGGAPVSDRFAREIGADGFADDAGAALRLFQGLAAAPQGPGQAPAPREARHAS
jgi:5-methyltetrahydrofolate--homocysteine methyltransferase